jgi:AAA domain
VFETQTALDLAAAIRNCREREPVLSTLSPLKEAIDRGLATLSAAGVEAEPEEISISIAGAETGPIDPDEGSLFVRLEKSEWGTVKLFVRGAFEEIEFRLDQNRKPFSAWRRRLGQKAIARIAQREFYHLTSALTVSGSDVTELTGIESLLQDPLIQTRIDELLASPASRHNVVEESEAAAISDDQAEDELAEEILVAPSAPGASEVDVPGLWRALIDVENELTTEGVAQLDSVADSRSSTHKVPIELESGEFDYARHDTVGVEKQDRKGHWRRIGDLDLRLSRPDMVFISARWVGIAPGACLVEAGQRLRFVSHFEFQSLRRRKDAVDRVLAGDGRSRDLLSAFDSRSGALPLRIDHRLDERAAAFYNLNADQKSALERLLSVRPVGMLQGPPGTGKTRFIAALTHYAITHGLARNVLLASQSHEAVNTAAEAVLTLFRQTGGHPSMLRVAMDELIVSPPLRPYYAARVEQSYKDKFNASFTERITIAGKAIGVPDAVVADILTLETAVRPIVARVTDFTMTPEDETKRINGLIETLRHHFASLSLPDDIEVSAYDTEWDSLVDDIAQQLIGRWERSGVVNADKIERLRRVCAIGSDFVGSVSRPQRSFETFLAGTRQIVAGTCVGLGRTSLGLTNTAFDLVIVDEAARCTASELLVPLQAARWVVLVGDQAQLEPQHKPEVVELVADRTGISKQEIKTSDFERVFYTPYGREASAALKTQYRMLPPIGQVVSDAFYPGLALLPGRHDPEIDPSALPDSLDKPLIWIETDGLATAAFDRKESSSSRVNKAEADAVIALLEQWHSHEPFREWLLNQTKHPAGVGVICMYAAQRNLIERRLRQSSMGYLLDGPLKVGTVDSYQGKQNPIIILSLVRNNDSGPMEAGIKRIQEGFLSVPNRVNVAASRAMDRLVIVGARRRWRSKSPIGLFNQAFEKQIALGFASVVPMESLLDRGVRTTAPPQQSATEGSLLSVGGAHANA